MGGGKTTCNPQFLAYFTAPNSSNLNASKTTGAASESDPVQQVLLPFTAPSPSQDGKRNKPLWNLFLFMTDLLSLSNLQATTCFWLPLPLACGLSHFQPLLTNATHFPSKASFKLPQPNNLSNLNFGLLCAGRFWEAGFLAHILKSAREGERERNPDLGGFFCNQASTIIIIPVILKYATVFHAICWQMIPKVSKWVRVRAQTDPI